MMIKRGKNMKPTICIGGFNDERLKKTRDAGFRFAELNFGQIALMSGAEIKEYVDKIKDMGFEIVAGNGFIPSTFNSDNGFFQPGFDINAFEEYVAMAFEKTSCIKWNSIAFGSGTFRKLPEEYEYEKACDFFGGIISDIIVPKLEKHDAVLSIEELNAGETNFLNSCSQVMTVAKQVNHPRVGILCDYYHMSLAGETADDVKIFAKYITHLHIASPLNKRAIPVKDDGDNKKYEEFFKALKMCGYDKEYLSVEGIIPGIPDDDKLLKACFDYLNSMTNAF